ncbi:MAG: hypothetical protein FJ096_23125 [Deltaproteobacteria bacterium]|nr:hypothetical protein [Deltaproteobacteria bacterium]
MIDPCADGGLKAVGVAGCTPWIEALAKAGFVGVVGPLPTGSIGFAPSQRFADLAAGASANTISREIDRALFPTAPVVVSRASTAVAKLRDEVQAIGVSIDRELLDVVLRELHDVIERDCRHASIALSGKLLELALGSLLLSWNVTLPQDATLSDLIGRVRGRANAQQPDAHVRAQANAVLGLGLDGLADLVRTVRNGAVHARVHREGGQRLELPSAEQTEAVVLLTVDLIRRFAPNAGSA